jgi:Sec-independent protein translocase protein TatA
LGRSLGRALNQLQAASDDFKRTWEAESRVEAGAHEPSALQAAAARAEGDPATVQTSPPAQAV